MAYGTILGQNPTAQNTLYNNTQTSSIITANNVQGAIDQLFQSVSNGKSQIASAITDKGVSTSASDSFGTMADNIREIESGIDFTAVTNGTRHDFTNGIQVPFTPKMIGFFGMESTNVISIVICDLNLVMYARVNLNLGIGLQIEENLTGQKNYGTQLGNFSAVVIADFTNRYFLPSGSWDGLRGAAYYTI